MFDAPEQFYGPKTTADSNAEGRMKVDAMGGPGKKKKVLKDIMRRYGKKGKSC